MSILDNFNFCTDPRTAAPRGIPTVNIEITDDDGELFDEERTLPWHWDVCPVCDGKGIHVNPAIDCNGLSGDDFSEDPDFAEDYFSGRYDQTCNQCNGRTTVPVVEEGRCTEEELLAWHEQLQAEDADRDAYLAELRAGA